MSYVNEVGANLNRCAIISVNQLKIGAGEGSGNYYLFEGQVLGEEARSQEIGRV